MTSMRLYVTSHVVNLLVICLVRTANGKKSQCGSSEDCGLKAKCRVKLGLCVCERGYTGDPKVKCERNKCKGRKDCHVKATCDKITGHCRCLENYVGDGTRCEYLSTASINIAEGRPAAQISTAGTSTADLAVDGDRNVCAKTERGSENPWWRVDLGHKVWVNKVLLATKTAMPDVGIKIGDGSDANNTTHKLCRQGLRVPSEPWLYECAEPVLGRYVHVRLLGKKALILCEVEVYVSHDLTVNYLASSDKQRVMQKGDFVRYEDPYHIHLKTSKSGNRSLGVHVTNIIVNEAPMRETLQLNAEVIVPVKYNSLNGGNVTASCGTWESKQEKSFAYVSGTIIREADEKYVVKVDYVPDEGKDKMRKVEEFTCSLKALRLRVNDICKLDTSRRCPSSSSCNTTFIVATFPPAFFYCKCAYGRPSPFFIPDKSCEKEKKIDLKPFIRHSKQNLALGMETEASSTDNFNGCRHKHCREKPAMSQFAVDGSVDSCFLSLTEQRPWFIVSLNRHHPIALIHVVLKKADKTEETMSVYIANHGHHVRCATIKTALIAWSTDCETNKTERYIWGNAVRIQTDSKTLHLCEVQIYAETYGNIVLKHPLSDEELLKTIDGNMKSCLPRTKMIEWRIDFGSRLRVAVVFLRLSWQFRDIEPYMKIETGFGNTKRKCMQTTEVVQNEDLGVYVDCEGVQMATYVAVNKIGHQRSLCEVEIFQTKTINVAARRPLLDSNERIYTGNLKPELCNDQRIDKVYSLRQNGHWAVDFLLRLDLKLMRIITDREYEMSIIEGLSILTGELPPFRKYGVKKVKDLTYNTKGNINTITFTRKIEARSLHVRSKSYLRVLEVEVYRGSLLDVREDECLKADACPPNFKCSNWPKQFSCECPTEGFRYVEEGHGKTRNKKCLDIDECKEQDSCPVTYSHCKNTLGSYLCLCNKGHEAIYDSDNRLQKCEDLDECKHPLLFNGCPKLSRCENLPGSYTCACEPGYESTEQYSDNDKAIECEEKDECNDESSCPVDHSYCINLKGSYNCTCNEGFKNVYDSNDRLKNCQDVDECKHPNTFRCPERSVCVNLAGSYTCECAQGYEPAIRSKTRGRDIKCKDVDECKEKTYSCHVKSTCTNSVGSYSCQCPLGMKGDGRTHCLELDPCTEDKRCKQKHQTCKDIKGELLCDCMDGFIRKAHQCKDKNECELNGTICNYHSECINTEGSYYCKCKPGYQRTSSGETNCADINECETGDACSDVATCKNSIGSYQCNCLTKGFQFYHDAQRKGCFDIDECKDPHICGPNEKCTNQPATYECSCSDGFESQDEEKLNCTDIDECFTNTYKCDSNSYCANSFGSYDCKCKGGYKKNSRGYCEEQCYEDCPEKSECKNGICRCLPGYAFGPFRECYKDDFFVATGSGKSVYLHKIPLVIGQLIYLACNVRISLTVF